MFTGIIEELGTVREAGEGRMIIDCKMVLRGTNLGDSIAVNGCAPTCAELEENGFHASVMPETYRRTNLGDLKPGDVVNLERALTLSQRLGGAPGRGGAEGTRAVETPSRGLIGMPVSAELVGACAGEAITDVCGDPGLTCLPTAEPPPPGVSTGIS